MTEPLLPILPADAFDLTRTSGPTLSLSIAGRTLAAAHMQALEDAIRFYGEEMRPYVVAVPTTATAGGPGGDFLVNFECRLEPVLPDPSPESPLDSRPTPEPTEHEHPAGWHGSIGTVTLAGHLAEAHGVDFEQYADGNKGDLRKIHAAQHAAP